MDYVDCAIGFKEMRRTRSKAGAGLEAVYLRDLSFLRRSELSEKECAHCDTECLPYAVGY